MRRQAPTCKPSLRATRRRSSPARQCDRELVDPRLGELLETASAGIGDLSRIGFSVFAQDLAYALARDRIARGDLVEAEALRAQRRHLAYALQRPRHGRAVLVRRDARRQRCGHRPHPGWLRLSERSPAAPLEHKLR